MGDLFVSNGRAGLLRLLGDDKEITKAMFVERCAKSKTMLRYVDEADLSAVFDAVDSDGNGTIERKEYVEALVDLSSSFDFKTAIFVVIGFLAFPFFMIPSLCMNGGFKNITVLASSPQNSRTSRGFKGFGVIFASLLIRSAGIHEEHLFYKKEPLLVLLAAIWWGFIYTLMLASFLVYCILANNRGWLKDDDRFNRNVNLIEACFPIIIYGTMAVQFSLLHVVSDEPLVRRIIVAATERKLHDIMFATIHRTTSPDNTPPTSSESAAVWVDSAETSAARTKVAPDRARREVMLGASTPFSKRVDEGEGVELQASFRRSTSSGRSGVTWTSHLPPKDLAPVDNSAKSILKQMGASFSADNEENAKLLLADIELSGHDLHDHINFITGKLLHDYKGQDRILLVVFCILGPFLLAFMSPILRVSNHQAFAGPDGPGGAFVCVCSILVLYTCFFSQFYQLIGVLREFSVVRWQMRAFSAIMNEGDSAFIYNDQLIEMPFLNLGDANNLNSFIEMRTFFQLSRISVVKRTEVVVGIIVSAIISFAIIILTLLILGSVWSVMSGVQYTLHGRTVLAILTWGAIVLSGCMLMILIAAVDVNEMQKNHVNTIASMKWKLLSECLTVSLMDNAIFVNEALIHLQRYDSVSAFLVSNDVFLGVLGFIFDAGTLQQIVVLIVSTIGTGVLSFIATGVGASD